MRVHASALMFHASSLHDAEVIKRAAATISLISAVLNSVYATTTAITFYLQPIETHLACNGFWPWFTDLFRPVQLLANPSGHYQCVLCAHEPVLSVWGHGGGQWIQHRWQFLPQQCISRAS